MRRPVPPGSELLIDCAEDRTLRAVLVGMLREAVGARCPIPEFWRYLRLPVYPGGMSEADALLCSIVSGAEPAEFVFQDDSVVAISWIFIRLRKATFL